MVKVTGKQHLQVPVNGGEGRALNRVSGPGQSVLQVTGGRERVGSTMGLQIQASLPNIRDCEGRVGNCRARPIYRGRWSVM